MESPCGWIVARYSPPSLVRVREFKQAAKAQKKAAAAG